MNVPALARDKGPCCLRRFIRTLENRPRFVEENFPRLRESHRARISFEQLHAEFILEVADLPAQGGLRDTQLRRRLGEIQVLGNGHEVTEVPEFHSHTFKVSLREKQGIGRITGPSTIPSPSPQTNGDKKTFQTKTMKKLQLLLQTDNSFSTLLIRVALGVVFFPHGAQKVLGWFGGYGLTGTMGFFTGTLGIPAFFAALAIAAEFLGSIALVAGALTRVAALGIAAVMAVAMTMHWQYGFFINWTGQQKGEGIEFHLLALAMALYLVIRGGGALSVDRAIADRSK